jgi:transposase
VISEADVVKRKQDPKVAALRAERILNPRPQDVTDEEFRSSEFFDARDLVQVKYEMVRRVRVDGAPVARAAAAFGFSRPSYYEAAAALARDGLPGLVPAKPGPRRGHKLTDEVLAHAEDLLAADASLRPADLVEALHARYRVRVHPRSVERALARRRQAGGSPKSG